MTSHTPVDLIISNSSRVSLLGESICYQGFFYSQRLNSRSLVKGRVISSTALHPFVLIG